MAMLGGSHSRISTAVRAPKTAELIAGSLRRQIVRGELKPGETLPPEAQLMEQYEVSRPTLREAFRILEAEALISVRRGSRGGAKVITPDMSVASRYVGLLLQVQGTTINDVYEARMVSEPACARLFALRRTSEDIEALTLIVDELKAEVAARMPFVPDPETWSRATYRFHELILEGCGNNTLAIQGGVLQDIVANHLRTRIAQSYDDEAPERFQRLIRSYSKFIALASARDAAGAEKHWHSHMKVAGQYLLNDGMKTKQVIDLFA